MSIEQKKKYIIIFPCIFLFLLAITWQQVVIFKLGYRITNLKEQIQVEEIKKQQIMKKYYIKGSLFNIEQRAKSSFNMKQPDFEMCRVLKVNKKKLFHNKNKKRISFISYFKDVLSPSDAEAK